MKRSNNKQRHYRSISVKLAKEAVAKFRGDKLRKTVMKKKELLRAN